MNIKNTGGRPRKSYTEEMEKSMENTGPMKTEVENLWKHKLRGEGSNSHMILANNDSDFIHMKEQHSNNIALVFLQKCY